MKMYNKNFLALLIIFLIIACEDRLEMENIGISQEGAVPVVTPGESTFFNLTDLETASVDFTVSLLGSAQTVRVFKNFNGSDFIQVAELTGFPSKFNVTIDEAIEGISGVTKEDLVPGDVFNFIFEVETASGKIYKTPTVLAVNASCPSNIPVGTFTATSGGTSSDGCPPENPLEGHKYDVTISSLGGGKYTISDFWAGVYQEWYGACYGYTFETSATFEDVCNNLSISVRDAFGCSNSGTGTFDPDTGIISMTWSNCFGDTGFWSVDTTP